MAKQRGQYQYTGRLGVTVGYSQRYAKDRYLRGLSEGQSERVKTSANYENLRKYNGEFGAVASFAGMAIKNFPSRFSSMLKPHRNSDLINRLLPLLGTSTAPLGRRTIADGDYNSISLHYLISLRKCWLFDNLSTSFVPTVEYDPNVGQTTISWFGVRTASDFQFFAKYGMTLIHISIYSVRCTPAVWSDSLNGFTQPVFDYNYLGSENLRTPEQFPFGFSMDIEGEIQNDFFLFVIEPYNSPTLEQSAGHRLERWCTFYLHH